MLSPSSSWVPAAETNLCRVDRVQVRSGRLLTLYGRLLGPLLAGYMLFDKPFAYLHVPGTPLYVGELVLLIGGLGTLGATGYLGAAVSKEPVLTLLAAFFLWGLFRVLPGIRAYGILAVRDFALVYYCLFAFFTAAALMKSPEILGRLVVQLSRFVPWLLAWLPIAVVLSAVMLNGPKVPTTSVPVAFHKPGDAAIAVVLGLGALWLLPSRRSPKSQAAWSIVALLALALIATQNRGGLLAAAAGITVGLMFVKHRLRLITRAVAVVALGLGLAALLSLRVPSTGSSTAPRTFSASQLFANVGSLIGKQEAGNLKGTVAGRDQLWSRILQHQTEDAHLIRGSGFGQNLALQVGVLDDGTDNLRSPHNSHLDVLARTGIVGISLWIAVWLSWYWRLIAGCRRLAQRGLHARRQVAGLCLMVTTATLVSSFFDPQLEGAQAAALLWVAFGAGIAVTSFRAWLGDHRDLQLATPGGRSGWLRRLGNLRRLADGKGAVHSQQTAQASLGGVTLLIQRSGLDGHGVYGRIVAQSGKPASPGIDVAGRGKPSALAGGQSLGHTTDVGRDDRRFGGHRFKQ